jgi:hypothetical protein
LLSLSIPVGVNGVAEVVDAFAAVKVLIMIDVFCCDDGNWQEYREEVHKEPIMVGLFRDHDRGLDKDDA